MSGSVCSFLFRPEKFNATLKKKWSSTGLQQTDGADDDAAFNLESSYVDQLLYVLCYAFGPLPSTNTLIMSSM